MRYHLMSKKKTKKQNLKWFYLIYLNLKETKNTI